MQLRETITGSPYKVIVSDHCAGCSQWRETTKANYDYWYNTLPLKRQHQNSFLCSEDFDSIENMHLAAKAEDSRYFCRLMTPVEYEEEFKSQPLKSAFMAVVEDYDTGNSQWREITQAAYQAYLSIIEPLEYEEDRFLQSGEYYSGIHLACRIDKSKYYAMLMTVLEYNESTFF